MYLTCTYHSVQAFSYVLRPEFLLIFIPQDVRIKTTHSNIFLSCVRHLMCVY